MGAIPVCDGQKLTGLVTDRDITVRAIAEGRNPADMKVSEIMSGDIAYCFEEDDIEKAAEVMESKQIRRLPILNCDKNLTGIVSLGDISVRSDRLGKQKAAQPRKILRARFAKVPQTVLQLDDAASQWLSSVPSERIYRFMDR